MPATRLCSCSASTGPRVNSAAHVLDNPFSRKAHSEKKSESDTHATVNNGELLDPTRQKTNKTHFFLGHEMNTNFNIRVYFLTAQRSVQ